MKLQRSAGSENRRAFVHDCLGLGATFAAAPAGSSQGPEFDETPSSRESAEPGMSEYERILSHTGSMPVLGNPRSWSFVSRGLHPFAPERVAVLPTNERIRYLDRCGFGI
jgi:hypothetical protein